MKLELTPTKASIENLLRVMDHRVSPLDNWQARTLGPITTPGVADTEFTVLHNLGIKPTYYIWNVDRNCVVYDSRRADWTASQMFLKASVASAVLYLIVL